MRTGEMTKNDEAARYCTECNEVLQKAIVDGQDTIVCRRCSRIEGGYTEEERPLAQRSQMQKPNWWPKCPYPESIFPMPRERYPEIVPDPATRTALSGCLGREFWNIASDTIWEAMLEATEDAHLTTGVQPLRRRCCIHVVGLNLPCDQCNKETGSTSYRLICGPDPDGELGYPPRPIAPEGLVKVSNEEIERRTQNLIDGLGVKSVVIKILQREFRLSQQRAEQVYQRVSQTTAIWK